MINILLLDSIISNYTLQYNIVPIYYFEKEGGKNQVLEIETIKNTYFPSNLNKIKTEKDLISLYTNGFINNLVVSFESKSFNNKTIKIFNEMLEDIRSNIDNIGSVKLDIKSDNSLIKMTFLLDFYKPYDIDISILNETLPLLETFKKEKINDDIYVYTREHIKCDNIWKFIYSSFREDLISILPNHLSIKEYYLTFQKNKKHIITVFNKNLKSDIIQFDINISIANEANTKTTIVSRLLNAHILSNYTPINEFYHNTHNDRELLNKLLMLSDINEYESALAEYEIIEKKVDIESEIIENILNSID